MFFTKIGLGIQMKMKVFQKPIYKLRIGHLHAVFPEAIILQSTTKTRHIFIGHYIVIHGWLKRGYSTGQKGNKIRLQFL